MIDDDPLPVRNFPFRFLGALHAWVWVKKPLHSEIETEPQSANRESSTADSSAAAQQLVQQIARRIAGPLAACLYCASLI